MTRGSYEQESCELLADSFKENQRTSKSQTTDLKRVIMVRCTKISKTLNSQNSCVSSDRLTVCCDARKS